MSVPPVERSRRAGKIVVEHTNINPNITLELSPEEERVARRFFLLTSKPILFAVNVAEDALAREVGVQVLNLYRPSRLE